MIKKLLYIVGCIMVLDSSRAQTGLYFTAVTDTIILKEPVTAGKVFLIHEDSIFRIEAPETAINDVLKTMNQTDPLNRIFRELNAAKSTNFFQKNKQENLYWDSVILLRELLKKGSCILIRRKNNEKLKAIVSKTFSGKEGKGTRYYADDVLLLEYQDLTDR